MRDLKLCDAYIGSLADGKFVDVLPTDPKEHPFMICQISNRDLEDFGKFEYFKGAESLWIGGMMKWVSHTVYVVSDDLDSGIFLFYNAMDAGALQFLGKLDNNCKLYEEILKKFKAVGKKLAVA